MRVLISGAGIAGPTAAYFLAKAGPRFDITILERTPAMLSQGQNIDVNLGAVDVMQKMGLLEEVRRNATTETGTQFLDPKGQPIASFPVKEGQQATATSEHEILRGDLALILYKATKDLPNVRYRFGDTIKQVISNDDNAVKVQLSTGEVEDFDALVAADGQWSKTRSMVFPDSAVQMVDKGVYITYFTVPKVPDANQFWNIYQGLDAKTVNTRPDPHGTTRVMLTCAPRGKADKRAWESIKRADRLTQEKHILQQYSKIGWQTPLLLQGMSSSPDFYLQAVQQIKMSPWHTSRVVCLGDAAFCPTPISGFGASLAIIGAHELAKALIEVPEGVHPKQGFMAYEKATRPTVAAHEPAPAFVPKILHPVGSLHRWVFQHFISFVAKLVSRS